MKSAMCLGLLVMLAGFGGASQAQAPKGAPHTPPADLHAWQKIGEAFDKNDCATVLAMVAPQLKVPANDPGAAKLRAIGYDMAASCAVRTGKKDMAYRYAMDGTALDDASDWIWRFRFGVELEDGHFGPALTTIEAMTQGRGAALNAVPVRWMYEFSNKLKAGHQDDLRRRLLKILTDPSYAPDEVFGTVDGFRQSYAEILYGAGDKDGAAALIREIDDPSDLEELSFDPRFRPMLPSDFDLRASVERSLAAARTAMSRHPELVEPITMVAMRLRQLGRPQEALAVLEPARATILREGGFADADDKANWWWDGVARTQAALGHYDEMVAAMRSGAEAKEYGEINVSQVINLAEAQVHFGKPEDALKTLAVFDGGKRSVSPYGEMEMRFARGCANALAGKKDALALDLAYARAHNADHREALSDLLLCIGDLDGAAAAFAGRLEDPEQRTAALIQLSDYDAPPVSIPADPVNANLEKLKARPDMKAAIARAGGIRRIHLQRDEL
jgi:hypothetical protein